MRWPWNRSEVRESAPYSDAVVASIVASAGGPSLAAVGATGALEAASSLVARSFASALVRSESAQVVGALSPSVLSSIGRAMVRTGECIFLITTDGGRLSLLPASSWDIQGGPAEDSWIYRLTIPGPTRIQTHIVPAQGVVHIRLQSDPSASWRGVAPLRSAYLAGKLSASTVAALADEVAGMPTGGLLEVPVDGADKSVDQLRADLKNLRGSLSLVESGDWGDVGAGRQRGGWQVSRIGADPPRALIELAGLASREVFNAVGIPIGLMSDATPGTGQREAFRRLAATLLGMSRVTEAELTEKLESETKLDFAHMMSADVVGKARAAGSLVKAGVEVERALGLAGLAEEN